MFRSSAIGLSLALFAGTTAYAAFDKVAEVNVEADLTVVQNAEAAAYWANLTTDLENAIVARLVDRIAEDGVTISVDLSEVELASAFEQAYNIADSVLVGEVNVKGEQTNANEFTYDLSVSMESVTTAVTADGTTIVYDTINSPEAYQALIGAFADNVVQSLDK
jgi:hypothetical protein